MPIEVAGSLASYGCLPVAAQPCPIGRVTNFADGRQSTRAGSTVDDGCNFVQAPLDARRYDLALVCLAHRVGQLCPNGRTSLMNLLAPVHHFDKLLSTQRH